MAISLLIFLTILLGLTLAVAVPVLRRLFKKPHAEEITPDWLENFSLDRYRSMSRLLADDDFAFLSRQPGFDLSLYKKLRRDRLQIFRQYFDRLIMDFNRLHFTARALVAANHNDSSELAGVLFQIQLRFFKAVVQTEVAYSLCRIGVYKLEVSALLEPLQLLSERLETLAVPMAA